MDAQHTICNLSSFSRQLEIILYRKECDEDVGVLAESLHLVIDQWIQYKLGKQYLWKKVTQPWESNPGPTPIRGELATIIVSVGLKKLVAIRHYIQVG